MTEEKPIIGDEYYIPTIEEFHIGFDYELYQADKWNKYVMSEDDTWYHLNKKFNVHIRKFIEWGKCRRLKTSK